MKLLGLDLETSLHNEEVGTFKASPHSPANWIVWAGLGIYNEETRKWEPRIKKFEQGAVDLPPPGPGTLLIGHNLKFDLSYLANPNNKAWEKWRAWIKDPQSRIWDTQVAEYRLRGQYITNPSQDVTCIMRGLTTKPGRLKEYWNDGISTEDIPDDEVEPYMTHDAVTPGHIFHAQMDHAVRLDMLPLLKHEMRATLALTAAEIDGMHFDKRGAMTKYEGEMADTIAAYELEMLAKFKEAGVPEEAVVPGSHQFLQAVIYGGTYKYQYRIPLLGDDGVQKVWKSGQKRGLLRFKVVKDSYNSGGSTRCPTEKVDAEALVQVKEHASTDPVIAEALDILLKWKKIKKQATTYFIGYSQLTWPHDSLIHGQLNQTITKTGRLSSSAPNLQNAAHSDIRTHFVSRVPGGYIMEADLSQIEVVVQGILSQDEAMLKDLHAGVDFHSKRAAIAAGVEYEVVRAAYLAEDPHWTYKRKLAKVFSFQRAYGAGAAKIALTTGMKFKEAMALIEAEKSEYPGVEAATKEWQTTVEKSAARVGTDHLGKLVSDTGARYVFTRENFKGQASFKPTTIKNYPVQGLAGDIIKVILSELRKVLATWNENHPNIKLVNTVHDSIIFDLGVLGMPFVNSFALDVHYAMTTRLEEIFKQDFDIDFQGLVKADIEIGENWYARVENEDGTVDNPLGMRGLKL